MEVSILPKKCEKCGADLHPAFPDDTVCSNCCGQMFREEQELNLMYRDKTEAEFENMLKYLRKIQLDFLKGDCEVSGIDLLTGMLQEGVIKMEMFLNMAEAVKNPEAPYEIIPKSPDYFVYKNTNTTL